MNRGKNGGRSKESKHTVLVFFLVLRTTVLTSVEEERGSFRAEVATTVDTGGEGKGKRKGRKERRIENSNQIGLYRGCIHIDNPIKRSTFKQTRKIRKKGAKTAEERPQKQRSTTTKVD
jgi:hypothetical protein